MNKFLFFLVSCLSITAAATPITFPVFVKLGQATILEFEEELDLIVLGDRQSFHVTKIRGHKLEIDALVPKAASNMFVFFKKQDPRSFSLVAAEDAEPTGYRKFESLKKTVEAKAPFSDSRKSLGRVLKVISSNFDAKKDYLTLDVLLSANTKTTLKPQWELARLNYNSNSIAPTKLWSERQDIQRDSQVKARFVFVKPNLPRALKGVSLVLPLIGISTPMIVSLGGAR